MAKRSICDNSALMQLTESQDASEDQAHDLPLPFVNSAPLIFIVQPELFTHSPY
jgi:hypothetical protein